MIRKEVKRLGIKCFHDAEPGISHQMMADYGLMRPGELVVGNDSHTISYGALNVGGMGITRADMLYALLDPTAELKKLEAAGNNAGRLALMEDMKTMPFGAVWDEACDQAWPGQQLKATAVVTNHSY